MVLTLIGLFLAYLFFGYHFTDAVFEATKTKQQFASTHKAAMVIVHLIWPVLLLMLVAMKLGYWLAE